MLCFGKFLKPTATGTISCWAQGWFLFLMCACACLLRNTHLWLSPSVLNWCLVLISYLLFHLFLCCLKLLPKFCLIVRLRCLFNYFSPPLTVSFLSSFISGAMVSFSASQFPELSALTLPLRAVKCLWDLFMTANTVPRPWGFFSPLLFSCMCLHVLSLQSSLLEKCVSHLAFTVLCWKICSVPDFRHHLLWVCTENAEYWEIARCKSQENGPS